MAYLKVLVCTWLVLTVSASADGSKCKNDADCLLATPPAATPMSGSSAVGASAMAVCGGVAAMSRNIFAVASCAIPMTFAAEEQGVCKCLKGGEGDAKCAAGTKSNTAKDGCDPDIKCAAGTTPNAAKDGCETDFSMYVVNATTTPQCNKSNSGDAADDPAEMEYVNATRLTEKCWCSVLKEFWRTACVPGLFCMANGGNPTCTTTPICPPMGNGATITIGHTAGGPACVCGESLCPVGSCCMGGGMGELSCGAGVECV